jgi:5-oxoprolinase (ATP-hydrolysing) subunit A
MKIDLNCDMGESFGRYQLGSDADIMPHVSSISIACGLHAGDPMVMRHTVELAETQEVKIGAHPGYPDLQGFGRRKMQFAPEEVEAFIIYQLGALQAFVTIAGGKLHHVKPHGALYNQACTDRALATSIARAVSLFDPQLILVGLAGSELLAMGARHGLPTAAEAFPDRAYNTDGSLMDRDLSGSLVTDPQIIAHNAVRLAKEGLTINEVHHVIDTLCLHSDHPHAAETARIVKEQLRKAHVHVRPLLRL